jgi:hypothetical protein
MKATLVQSNSGRFYLESSGELIDSAHLSLSNCYEMFLLEESNRVQVEVLTEFDFNGIGYSEIPKLDKNGNFILKKI